MVSKAAFGQIGVMSGQLAFGESPLVEEAAAELDELGFGAIWIPGGLVGGVEGRVDRMLGATRRAIVATAILNIWKQPPAELGAWWRERCPDPSRVMLGLGVSHSPFIAEYRKPLAAMRDYLDAMDDEGIPAKSRCIAALAPKMLELARDRTAGSLPYLVTPDHTAWSRERLGPAPLLATEQGVILETDPATARAIARANLDTYKVLPNYANNWRRLGFSEEDIASSSDRLVDALYAWGTLDQVRDRVQAHLDAGADHVPLHVIQREKVGDLQEARAVWRELAALL
jgi:probable F420-dependent oxidoreductase